MTIKALILESVDTATGSVADGVDFAGEELMQLLALLEKSSSDFTEMAYELQKDEIAHIRELFPSKNIPETVQRAIVRGRHALDDLPYNIHTNRELSLMLRGEKPLAVFCDPHVYGEDTVAALQIRKFESHAASGRFVKRENIETDLRDARFSVQRVFYALPAQAWRIDAYILMQKIANLSGWNDGFERMEGALLGYTDAQNEIHLEHRKCRKSSIK